MHCLQSSMHVSQADLQSEQLFAHERAPSAKQASVHTAQAPLHVMHFIAQS